jgi:hypothetical protein
MIVSRMFQLTALQTGPARMPKSTGETVTEIQSTTIPAVTGQNVSLRIRSLRRNAHESV